MLKYLSPIFRFVALLIVTVPLPAQSARPALPYGPYKVGYRDFVLRDLARNVDAADSLGEPLRSPRPRALHISVWYPAAPSAGSEPMQYGDYLDIFSLSATLPVTGPGARDSANAALLRYPNLLLVGQPIRARRDTLREAIARERLTQAVALRAAAPLAGSFPVVIYTAGQDGPSFENEALLEYLASKGYIVYGMPCWMGLELNPSAFDVVARDLETLIGHVRSEQSASQPIGLMGWSCGGYTSVSVANRNSSVSAVVGLDASVRYLWSDGRFRNQFAVGRPSTPVLFLNQANTAPSTLMRWSADTGFTYFDSLRYTDAYLVRFRNIRHQNFASMYNRLQGPHEAFVQDPTIAQRAYVTIATYASTFLDAYLKNDAAAKDRLGWNPAQLGVPDTSLDIVRKRGTRPLPTIASFRAAVRARGGGANAPQVLDEIRRNDPGYAVPDRAMSDWGWSVGGQAQLGVFLARSTMHPANPGAFSDLGDAYLGIKDTVRAISAFERVLQLDSTSSYARDQLLKLRRR